MRRASWLLHPVFIFVFSILALGLSLFLYIYWYVSVSSGLRSVISKFDLDPGQFFEFQTWVVIVVLSILVGIIFTGIFIIFAYQVKTVQLYRLQHNFINNFTHELKTPVTSMQLYLETFRKYDLGRDKQLKYIDYMLADAAHLTNTINRILSLARLESRTYEGEFVTLDLVETVESFCSRNRQQFKDCTVSIHNPSGRSFPYAIDLSLFEMLLRNLLTNAIRYNASETPRVDITFTAQDDKLHIAFADNGIGLEKREFKRIFKKFYQVEQAAEISPGGSGIGLYLVDNIARLHGGKVKATSAGAGKGATFTVTLPLRPDEKSIDSPGLRP